MDEATKTTALVEFVKDYVEKSDSHQSPIDGRLKGANDQNGEFVFRKKISEKDIWDIALSENNKDNYQKYLKLFPDGEFVEVAKRKILNMDDEAVWQKAIDNGTPDYYKAYIDEFPMGLHIPEARKRLDAAIEQIKSKQREARDAAQKAEELEKLRWDYKNRVHEAESLFEKHEYSQAHQKYWESLQSYAEGYGFVPGDEYVKSRIQECNEFIRFHELKSEGEAAYALRDYRNAGIYFQQALKIKPDEQLRKRAEDCTQLMQFNELQAEGELAFIQKDYKKALQFFKDALEVKQDERVMNLVQVCQEKVEFSKLNTALGLGEKAYIERKFKDALPAF
ncbi:MAG: hypothetical protein IPM82_07375 [Saprospiraceae bacterium]|nr:hypothetical protein [Saprospiraceae bacterium]